MFRLLVHKNIAGSGLRSGNFCSLSQKLAQARAHAQAHAQAQARHFSSTRRTSFRISNYNYHPNIQAVKKGTLFTVLFVSGTTLAIPYLLNETPLRRLKANSNYVIYSLIGLNVLAFGLWHYRPCYRLMNRFAILEKSFGFRPVQMITSVFSHREPLHLAFNMLALYSFGTALCSVIGVDNFLLLYLNGGVISSLVSMIYPLAMRIPIVGASLGASGALFGVFGTFAYLIPKAGISLFFFPIPGGAWTVFLGSVVWNVCGVVLRWGSFDYAAHLGGCAIGVCYGWLLSRRAKRVYRVY